jgi:hypothetical protein
MFAPQWDEDGDALLRLVASAGSHARFTNPTPKTQDVQSHVVQAAKEDHQRGWKETGSHTGVEDVNRV